MKKNKKTLEIFSSFFYSFRPPSVKRRNKSDRKSSLRVAPRPLCRGLVVTLPVREELLRDGADERVILSYFFSRFFFRVSFFFFENAPPPHTHTHTSPRLQGGTLLSIFLLFLNGNEQRGNKTGKKS